MYAIIATGLSVAAIIVARRYNNPDPAAGNVVAGFGLFLLLVAVGDCHSHF